MSKKLSWVSRMHLPKTKSLPISGLRNEAKAEYFYQLSPKEQCCCPILSLYGFLMRDSGYDLTCSKNEKRIVTSDSSFPPHIRSKKSCEFKSMQSSPGSEVWHDLIALGAMSESDGSWNGMTHDVLWHLDHIWNNFQKRPPALPCPSTKSKVCADGLVLIRSQLCHQPTILLLIQNATQHATYQQRIVRPQPASFIQHQAMSFCQASGMRPFPLQKSAGQTPDLVAFAVWRLPIP